MPGSTSSALDPILLQLGRVRRRWNTRELVRAQLALAAVSAFLTALLVLAALATAPRRFVAAATLLAVAWLASAIGIGLALRRRRLPARAAHHRIDRHARLGGRLAALVDLGATAGGPALRPLLAAENAAMRPLWTAERLVPRRVPAGALAAAVAAAGALAAAIALGPVLAPPPLTTVIVRDTRAQRVPLRRAASEPLPRGGVVAEAQGTTEDAAEAEDSFLGGVADAVQQRVQREDWGEAEAIRAQELARAEEQEPSPDPRRERTPDGQVGAPEGESGGRVEPGNESREPDAGATEVAEGGGTPQPTDAEPTTGVQRGAGTADGAARGAGTGTSPDLYGAPAGDVIRRAAAPFTLGLTADVHATGGASRPPTGETPLQMPDANPALADRPQEAVAVPRAPVPPEYVAIVRRLFEREP
jgi:hypothetical protein